MASKNISLSEDVYRLLLGKKGAGESFSDVVRRLANKPNPLDYVGAWADIPDREIDAMKRDIKEWRRSGDAKLRRKLSRRRR